MKKKSQLKLTADSFSHASTLRELMAKSDQHSQAEQQVIKTLPGDLAQGSRFISCREGELVIATDTSTKASRIRFQQQEIMAAVREYELFRFVWKLKVKVLPTGTRSRSMPKITPLSNENARLLKEEAGNTKDKSLREVLEKLASHVGD